MELAASVLQGRSLPTIHVDAIGIESPRANLLIVHELLDEPLERGPAVEGWVADLPRPWSNRRISVKSWWVAIVPYAEGLRTGTGEKRHGGHYDNRRDGNADEQLM